ncbi:hypothetical protein F8388_020053 [Cannabis sativa]|uniref:Uncharacterized protein n=1 Tax=Cannabis sativa TaxID=3483 RepID=A0A7J6E1H1_CANSA|nr:hypothetical protein F8388_020053 [Cannabis sativa]
MRTGNGDGDYDSVVTAATSWGMHKGTIRVGAVPRPNSITTRLLVARPRLLIRRHRRYQAMQYSFRRRPVRSHHQPRTKWNQQLFQLTVVVYIQDNLSWVIGFGIPTVFMAGSIVFFFVGAPLYNHVKPEGSIFSGIAQVFVAAFKKRRLMIPAPTDNVDGDGSLLFYDPPLNGNVLSKLPRTNQFRFGQTWNDYFIMLSPIQLIVVSPDCHPLSLYVPSLSEAEDEFSFLTSPIK